MSIKKKFKIYSIFLLGATILYFVTTTILNFFFNGYDFERDYSIADILFLSLIFAPVFETFLCQLLIFRLSFRVFHIKKTKKSIHILCIISALFFASLHYYNLGYIFFALIIGLYLSYTFAYAEYFSKEKISGYKLTVFIHFSFNFMAFIYA
ncbi:MAG: type II CAAX prenyl endopeptidase Rce1 family protein [Paludibacteraceae bacterium]